MEERDTPYRVSALKWRPQTFREIVGQDPVCATLQNALSSGRVAHAYLFAGSRGVGKTTTARVLAKALNCHQGPAPEPCDACASCVEIREGRAIDVIEIDGASNRGIDQVRDLREKVRYAPVRDRHKVYIIDEVHMLTEQAFNALLKTLEEPPEHVIFVFATTDPRKIPITILSRCQRFDFRRLSPELIVRHLAGIAAHEEVAISEHQLEMIAARSEGSMRDAQSLLDQVVAYSGGEVTDEAVATVLGITGREVMCSFVERVAEGDGPGLLALVDELAGYGRDLADFSGELLRWFRNLLVYKISEDASFLTELTSSYVEAVRQLSGRFSPEELQQHCFILCQLCEEIRRSQYPRYVLEMAAIRMTRVPAVVSLADVLDRLQRLQVVGAAGPGEAEAAQVTLDYSSRGAGREEDLAKGPERVETSSTNAPKEPGKALIEAVGRENPLVASILAGAKDIRYEAGELVIDLPVSDRSSVNLMKEGGRLEALQKAVRDVLGEGVRAVLVFGGKRTVVPSQPTNSGGVASDGAARRGKQLIQSAIDLFKGTLVTE